MGMRSLVSFIYFVPLAQCTLSAQESELAAIRRYVEAGDLERMVGEVRGTPQIRDIGSSVVMGGLNEFGGSVAWDGVSWRRFHHGIISTRRII